MVSTHLKNISQNGNLPQIGVKIKNIWNHHLGKVPTSIEHLLLSKWTDASERAETGVLGAGWRQDDPDCWKWLQCCLLEATKRNKLASMQHVSIPIYVLYTYYIYIYIHICVYTHCKLKWAPDNLQHTIIQQIDSLPSPLLVNFQVIVVDLGKLELPNMSDFLTLAWLKTSTTSVTDQQLTTSRT